jgi:hypothetical protein
MAEFSSLPVVYSADLLSSKDIIVLGLHSPIRPLSKLREMAFTNDFYHSIFMAEVFVVCSAHLLSSKGITVFGLHSLILPLS